jgi:hypothetical protein
MINANVPEIDVLIETIVWLHSNGWVSDTVSLPKGQGFDSCEQIAKLCIRLTKEGIKLPKQDSRGPDIIARKEDDVWKIECKGLGKGVAQTLRNNFDRALASAVSYFDQKNGLRIGIALPKEPTYLGLVQSRIPRALRESINMWVFLWDEGKKRLDVIEPNQQI